MNDFLRLIFSTDRYSTPLQKERARLIYGIITVFAVGFAAYLAFFPGTITTLLVEAGVAQVELASWLVPAVFFGLGLAGYVLVAIGRAQLASLAAIGMIALSIGPLGMLSGYESAGSVIPLVLLIFLGGLLSRERGLVFAGTFSMALYLAGVSFFQTQADGPTATSPAAVLIELAAAVGITWLYLRNTRQDISEGLAAATADRLKLAEITTEISHQISSRTALNDVLSHAVEQIIANYPRVYHAQIFLLDDARDTARLVASTGQAGRLLLQRKHSLEVGSESVIGQVTLRGEAVISRAGAANSVHRRNEFLPDTVAEAAFPLKIGDQIIGALDMQSKQTDIFYEADLPIFQALANNLAVAIDNARLFEETERQLASNQRLVEQSKQAIQEIERLNRQLVGRAWERYLQGRSEAMSLTIDFQDRVTMPVAEVTPTLDEAIRNNELVLRQDGGGQIVAVPVRVAGVVVGGMEFELGEDGQLSPDDLQLVNEVGERFGLAMENVRLFEESQRIAYREAMVAEIGTRLQASNNVEAVLAEAARSLQQTLNVGKVAIRLGTPPARAAVKGNGQS